MFLRVAMGVAGSFSPVCPSSLRYSVSLLLLLEETCSGPGPPILKADREDVEVTIEELVAVEGSIDRRLFSIAGEMG